MLKHFLQKETQTIKWQKIMLYFRVAHQFKGIQTDI